MTRLTPLLLTALLALQAIFLSAAQKPIETPHIAAAPKPAASVIAAVAAPKAAAPAAPVSVTVQVVGEQLKAISVPGASDASSTAGLRNVQAILQGGKAADAAAGVAAVEPTAAAPVLAAAQPKASDKPAVEPPQPAAEPAKVGQRRQYDSRRSVLAYVANVYGRVFSLPQADARLTSDLLREAQYKDALVSDIDDTLAKYNTVLEKETVAAIVALRRQGKTFAVITDRRDKVKPGDTQISAFDTMASIPAAERAGIIVATDGGGKIYRYDAQGEPKLESKAEAISAADREKIVAAVKAVQEAMPDAYVKQFENPYGHGIGLKLGLDHKIIVEAAELFEKELRARGINYEVEGRVTKNPTVDAPYASFSILNKSVAVKLIMELEKLEADRTVFIGDNMYKPADPKKYPPLDEKGEAAVKLARRLSGRDIPLTGNETDRNMERSLPGTLTLSVGQTADPRMKQAYVLDGKGPAVTRSVIEAMAKRQRGATPLKQKLAGAALIAAIVLMMAVFYGSIAVYLGQGVHHAEQQMRSGPSVHDLLQ